MDQYFLKNTTPEDIKMHVVTTLSAASGKGWLDGQTHKQVIIVIWWPSLFIIGRFANSLNPSQKFSLVTCLKYNEIDDL